jgi:hypothetical protein
MKQFASDEFGSQIIRRVEILSERISGNQAEVRYILHYLVNSAQTTKRMPQDSFVVVGESGVTTPGGSC